MSSPERPPIKKTYLSRAKKNKNTQDDTSYSESESGEDIIMTDAKPASKPSRKETATEAKPPSKASRKDRETDVTPASKDSRKETEAKPSSKASRKDAATDTKPASKDSGEETATDAKPASKASRKQTAPPPPVSPGKAPRKVEVHLPGPSPRTAKADAQNASPSVKKGKSLTHNRSASSISSMKRIHDDATDSPSSKKPLSAISRKSRFATPEDTDDNASVAESSMSMAVGSIRRTEAERIEYFNNQPDCANIDPHSVTCTRCNKVVQLGRKQTYTVKPWETHRKRCDRSVLDDEGSVRSDIRSEVGGVPAPRLTEAQRKAVLEADQRAETVQPDQVLCRKCQKWIRLSSRTAYALYNWNTHQSSCADAVMSSRVAMAQRKITLVNDPQAKSFGPRNVECRFCDTNVALTGEWDYTLTNWELHKQTCSSPPPSKMAAKTPRATRSSASTEATVVAGPSEASSSRGTKRRLEDPELDVDDPDARQPNRPRKENYVPVPGLLSWILMPFKAFMAGFKESIAETPP